MSNRVPARIVAAIREEPWLIQPAWLATLDEIAHRASDPHWSMDTAAPRGAGPEIAAAGGGKPLAGARSTTVVDRMAVVPVYGPIFPRANALTEMSGASSLTTIIGDIRTAAAAADVDGIMLDIDSPGGIAQGVAEAADAIRDASGDKPMVAYVSGTGASAAYWLAAAAPRIVAHRTAQIGSIGVVAGVQVQEQPDRDGYRTIEVVSSNAANKRPDPRTESGMAAIVDRLDAMETVFIDDVARLRGVTADRVRADFGRGGTFIGGKAVAAGMADEVGDFASALALLRSQLTTGVNAGFPASRKEHSMTTQTRADAAPAAEDTPAVPSISAGYIRDRHPDIAAELRREGVTAERDRQSTLSRLAEPGDDALLAELRASDVTVEAAAIRLADARRERRLAALADREQGAPAPVPVAQAPVASSSPPIDASAPIEERAKAEWDRDPVVRSEFGSFNQYLAFRRAEDGGQVKILRRA